MTTLQMQWKVRDDTLKHRLNLAIKNEQTIQFRYTKIGERDWKNRAVSPYEVQSTGTGDVLVTWDHEREAIRSFHLDGIDAVTTCPWYEYRPPEEKLPPDHNYWRSA